MSMRRPNFSTVMLVLGLLFLYLPMFVLVVYSFNASKLVTVWAGFSTQWYGELFQDQQILSAVWTSLRIAFFAASMAVCLGTVAAFVMTRYGHFRGKTALSSSTAFAAAAICADGADYRLARRPGHGDYLDCPYHLLQCLRGGRGGCAPAGSGSLH